MKRTAILLSALVLALGAFTSCGSGSGSSSADDKPASTGSTLPSDISERARENLNRQLEETKKKSSSSGKSSVPCDPEAEAAAKELVTSMFTNEPEKVMEYMYPKSMSKLLIEAGAAKNFQSAEVNEFELKEFHIQECSRLAPDTGYKWVEKYYKTSAENNGISGGDVTVTNGYSVKLSFRIIADGEEDSDTEDAVLAYIEGDGWKVIPFSISDIQKQLEAAGSDK